jgi:hypothetical protein
MNRSDDFRGLRQSLMTRFSRFPQMDAFAAVEARSHPRRPRYAEVPIQPTKWVELATLTGRQEASLSRTLRRFAELGIVRFQDGPHRTRIPKVIARRVHLETDLTGRHSAVAVEGAG